MAIVGCTVGAAIVVCWRVGCCGASCSESAQNDPAILAGAVLVPMVSRLIACWLPARRAAATNPVEALRSHVTSSRGAQHEVITKSAAWSHHEERSDEGSRRLHVRESEIPRFARDDDPESPSRET
jgi:hypothetical protein